MHKIYYKDQQMHLDWWMSVCRNYVQRSKCIFWSF